MRFKRLLKGLGHIRSHKTSGGIPGRKKRKRRCEKTVRLREARQGHAKTGINKDDKPGAPHDGGAPMANEDRDKTMARFDMQIVSDAAMGGDNRADALCEMGLAYATGRGRPVDLVAAHKWLNIAAIKGSDRAAGLRADLAATMSKTELAAALRAAREWMTMH